MSGELSRREEGVLKNAKSGTVGRDSKCIGWKKICSSKFSYVVPKVHLFYQCDYASIMYGRPIVDGCEQEHDAFTEGKSNHRTRVTQVQ